jgi:hypothetical protein
MAGGGFLALAALISWCFGVRGLVIASGTAGLTCAAPRPLSLACDLDSKHPVLLRECRQIA